MAHHAILRFSLPIGKYTRKPLGALYGNTSYELEVDGKHLYAFMFGNGHSVEYKFDGNDKKLSYGVHLEAGGHCQPNENDMY